MPLGCICSIRSDHPHGRIMEETERIQMGKLKLSSERKIQKKIKYESVYIKFKQIYIKIKYKHISRCVL